MIMLPPPQENAPLFGGRATAPQPPGSGGAGQAGASLLSENRRLGLSLPLPRTHASVFHAGVIGQGLQQKLPTKRVSKVRLGVPLSCMLVLIIRACCCVGMSSHRKVASRSCACVYVFM